jgi:Protein of unknown function (DUF3800)
MSAIVEVVPSSQRSLPAVLSGVRQLVAGLSHDLFSEYRIVVLKAFIDDSGSGGDSPWYILAGYVGTVAGWDGFDGEWTKALHRHPRIEYFKAREAESLRPDGQWKGITPEQRDAKIDELIEVIGRCADRAIFARIRQSDYNELIKGRIPEDWDSPYYFLQTFIIGAAINIERIEGRFDSIDFVFDLDQQHEKNQRLLLQPLQNIPAFFGALANISRKDDRVFLPLQAADLVAWQIRRFFCSDEPPRRHFESSQRSLPMEPHGFILDRGLVRSMMDDIYGNMQKNADKYARYLSTRGEK